MKVSLVVATGAHEGRVIPVTGPQFLIGRDAQCHLRPASQAISKLHCAVLVRDGRVFVKDFGSTNGTLVNDGLIQDTEIAIENGATLRVGPLDFRVQIEAAVSKADGTPLPGGSVEAAALAAVKAATTPGAPARGATPNPVKSPSGVSQPAKPGAPTKPGSKEVPKPAAAQETPSLTSSESVSDEDHDRIAAMLLGMDDNGNGSVPDGSTVMDMPTPLAEGGEAKPDDKKDDKPKPAQTREEMSSAASDLLRKYMRRPK